MPSNLSVENNRQALQLLSTAERSFEEFKRQLRRGVFRFSFRNLEQAHFWALEIEKYTDAASTLPGVIWGRSMPANLDGYPSPLELVESNKRGRYLLNKVLKRQLAVFDADRQNYSLVVKSESKRMESELLLESLKELPMKPGNENDTHGCWGGYW